MFFFPEEGLRTSDSECLLAVKPNRHCGLSAFTPASSPPILPPDTLAPGLLWLVGAGLQPSPSARFLPRKMLGTPPPPRRPPERRGPRKAAGEVPCGTGKAPRPVAARRRRRLPWRQARGKRRRAPGGAASDWPSGRAAFASRTCAAAPRRGPGGAGARWVPGRASQSWAAARRSRPRPRALSGEGKRRSLRPPCGGGRARRAGAAPRRHCCPGLRRSGCASAGSQRQVTMSPAPVLAARGEVTRGEGCRWGAGPGTRAACLRLPPRALSGRRARDSAGREATGGDGRRGRASPARDLGDSWLRGHGCLRGAPSRRLWTGGRVLLQQACSGFSSGTPLSDVFMRNCLL